MPPYSAWYRGREAVTSFLARHLMAGGRGRPTVPTCANGQLAFGHYRLDENGGGPTVYGMSVVTLRGARIEAITAFLMPDLLGRFGLSA